MCRNAKGVYEAMVMVRLQILVTPEENAAVRLEAQRVGVSVSELIRRQLQPLVDPDVDRANDPLLALEGFLGPDPEGITDGSVNHDKYLYGTEISRPTHRQTA